MPGVPEVLAADHLGGDVAPGEDGGQHHGRVVRLEEAPWNAGHIRGALRRQNGVAKFKKQKNWKLKRYKNKFTFEIDLDALGWELGPHMAKGIENDYVTPPSGDPSKVVNCSSILLVAGKAGMIQFISIATAAAYFTTCARSLEMIT